MHPLRVCLFYIQQPTNMSVTMHGAPSWTPTPKKQPAHCAGLFFSRGVSSGARLSLPRLRQTRSCAFIGCRSLLYASPLGWGSLPSLGAPPAPRTACHSRAHFVKGKPLRGDSVTLDNIFDVNIKKHLTITLLTIIIRVSSIAGYQNGHTYKAVQL